MAIYTKKQLGRIQPGTFVTLEWKDAPDEVVLLLEKIDITKKGDISLRYLTKDSFSWTNRHVVGISGHAIHSQIIDIGETLVFPEPVRKTHNYCAAKMAALKANTPRVKSHTATGGPGIPGFAQI